MPLFWTFGDVSSGFQSQSGQPYLHFAEAYMLHKQSFYAKFELTSFLPPANVVCEGYVFTHVCHSVHRGGHAWSHDQTL